MYRRHRQQNSQLALLQSASSHVGKRSGFTLVELLIVIAIIVTLLSILGVTLMSMVGSARVMATKGTITKVQGLLQARIEGLARKDPEGTLIDSLVPRFGNNRRRAEAMARKFTYRQTFPQTWAQVPPNLLVGLPSTPAIPPATPPRKQESSEVLHFILTRANVPGFPPIGEDSFASSEVADTDSNGWPEFIDAWGQPLRFYRWPTRLIRGGGYAPGAFTPTATARLLIPVLPTTGPELTRDPDDKYGQLKGFFTPAQILEFEFGASMGPLANLGAFHTLDTYSLPLVVSGGPDLLTGLYEPNDPNAAHFGYLCGIDPAGTVNTYDDISNYNSRSGGR